MKGHFEGKLVFVPKHIEKKPNKGNVILIISVIIFEKYSHIYGYRHLLPQYILCFSSLKQIFLKLIKLKSIIELCVPVDPKHILVIIMNKSNGLM